MNAPALELVKLTKRLPSGDRELTILDAVDLAVAPGEFVAILGPSGSGKSTLLGLAAGLDRPTEGEVRIGGRPIQALSEDELARLRRGRIGFVFQSFQLLPNLTALENVLLPLELAGRAEPLARARALLAEVGLAEREHHYPVQLSGGEQQRVALARALVNEPELLIADEPTGNLDHRLAQEVMRLFSQINVRGTTVLVATHDVALIKETGRRCLTLDRGEILEGLVEAALPPQAAWRRSNGARLPAREEERP